MKVLTTRLGGLVISLAILLTACADDRFDNLAAHNDDGTQTAQTALTPSVEAIEKDAIVIGETLYFYGENFLRPEDGQTYLVFEGKYVWSDGETDVHEQIAPFTIKGLYDGEFPDGATIGDMDLVEGAQVLRWNRFGPFEVPFGGQGRKPGVFEGTVRAFNVTVEGEEYEDATPLDVRLEVKPSILITRLEPVIGYTEDNEAFTAECGSPALRVFGGLPYILEVETMGFEPEREFRCRRLTN